MRFIELPSIISSLPDGDAQRMVETCARFAGRLFNERGLLCVRPPDDGHEYCHDKDGRVWLNQYPYAGQGTWKIGGS